MKKITIITVVALLLLSIVGLAACSTAAPQQTVTEIATVTRGDLEVTVSGSGQIQNPGEVSLAFTGGGRIADVPVTEGQMVSAGDLLISLDTAALELAKSQAEVSLDRANTAVTQAELAVKSAQRAAEKVAEAKPSLDLAVLNAQIALKQANYALETAEETYTWPDLETAQADLDNAKTLVQYATDGLANATTPSAVTMWTNFLVRAQGQLDAAQAKVDAIFKGYDTKEVEIKKLQVQSAEQAVANAQQSVVNLENDIAAQELQVSTAQESLTQTKQAAQLAQLSLDEVNRQINEATLTAPFDGQITYVGPKSGEIASPSVPVIRMVDNSTLDLVIQIDEIDIPDVKEGQKVNIDVDALTGQQFTGTVSLVYPMPNDVGGVVLYDVKISIDNIEGSQLRAGMSASADIVLQSSENTLMVPSRAVEIDSNGNQVVQVQVAEGQTETRQVTTGISNGLQTEILSGLSEGEKVVVTLSPQTETSSGLFF